MGNGECAGFIEASPKTLFSRYGARPLKQKNPAVLPSLVDGTKYYST